MPLIGVSLPVPEPCAGELQRFRESTGDPAAAHIPTHITLVPPVEVPDSELGKVEQHLAEVAARLPAYPIHLRGTGTFRPVSEVVFVSLVEGISQTQDLADAIRQGPLDVEIRFPYHPHVTVAHDVAPEQLDRAFRELAGNECLFLADKFAMYVHDTERGWLPTREFPLRSADD